MLLSRGPLTSIRFQISFGCFSTRILTCCLYSAIFLFYMTINSLINSLIIAKFVRNIKFKEILLMEYLTPSPWSRDGDNLWKGFGSELNPLENFCWSLIYTSTCSINISHDNIPYIYNIFIAVMATQVVQVILIYFIQYLILYCAILFWILLQMFYW